MESSATTTNRRVLPRWRSFGRTTTNELKSSAGNTPAIVSSDPMVWDLYRTWRDDPSIQNASEVVDAALLASDASIAVGPARQMLESGSAVMPAVRFVAKRILHGEREVEIENVRNELIPEGKIKDSIQTRIRKLKRRSLDEPRNGLLWLELARQYSAFGQEKSAEKAIKKAIAVAPNNRFILRTAVRFFTHIGQPDIGHDIVRRADGLSSDPWIQSAEIAVASVTGRRSRAIRPGRLVLANDSVSPVHKSELASAIGTEELVSGRNRRAKRLFLRSLAAPTENSLAQAQWASHEINLDINRRMFDLGGAFEARALYEAGAGNFEAATIEAIKWNEDEPFSVGPSVFGSFIASSVLQDHKLAEQIVERGLIANHSHPALLNNYIVVLARLGDISAARSVLARLKSLDPKRDERPVLLATEGLVNFRDGNLAEGGFYYAEAMKRAVEQKELELALRAQFHWLFEETLAGRLSASTIVRSVEKVDENIERLGSEVGPLTRVAWQEYKPKIESAIAESEATGESLFSPLLM